MPIRVRKIDLPGNGIGTVVIPPSYITGHKGGGGYTLSRSGVQLASGGTVFTFLTRKDAVFADGAIEVGGQPSDTVQVWFDFA